MSFCRTIAGLLLLFCFQCRFWAAVPQFLQVQGRFMTLPASPTDLSRPIFGKTAKQITVNFRPYLPGGLLDQTVFSHTLNNVIVEDGVYDLEIPVPDTLPFDRQYALELVVLTAGGGNLGAVPLVSVPYAFTAKNALKLGGLLASAYSRVGHGHDSAVKSFTIDGTGQGVPSAGNRFTVVNGSQPGLPGAPVFTVDSEGSITKVGLMSLSGNIISESGLSVFDANGRSVVSNVNSNGDLSLRNLQYRGSSSAVTMNVTGTSRLEGVRVDGQLSFSGVSSLIARPGGEATVNLIGVTHRLEDHPTSPLMQGLISLTSGQVVTAGQHTHAVKDNMFGADSLESSIVTSQTIIDGSIRNEDIADNANIPDTALANITSVGKIAESALPQQLAFKNRNNVFGAGFSGNQAGSINTRNDFDELRSKRMTIIATNGISGNALFEAKSFASEFRWVLENDGALSFRRAFGLGSEEVRLLIKPQGNRARMEFNKFRFLGDTAMITGTNIQAGVISNTQLIDNSIQGAKLQDGAVTNTKLQNASISTAKLATGAVTADKIALGAITNEKIANGAITIEKIYGNQESDPEEGKITNVKFQDLVITGAKIQGESLRAENIATNSIGPEHIVSLTLTEEFIAVSTLTASKLTTASILNHHLRDNVIALRAEPINIRVSNPTTAVMTINHQNTNQTAIQMAPNAIPNLPGTIGNSIAMKVDNSQSGVNEEYLALHLDGRLSVKSSAYTTVLTLNAYDMSVLFGVPKQTPVASADCPSIADTGYRLVAAAAEEAQGGGFCAREVTPGVAANFYSAMQVCNNEGAQVCSAQQIVRVCRANFLIQTNYMTRDMVDTNGAGDVHTVVVSPTVLPCTNTDFNYSTRDVDTVDTTRFVCCFQP